MNADSVYHALRHSVAWPDTTSLAHGGYEGWADLAWAIGLPIVLGVVIVAVALGYLISWAVRGCP